jgi:hypothetical protein
MVWPNGGVRPINEVCCLGCAAADERGWAGPARVCVPARPIHAPGSARHGECSLIPTVSKPPPILGPTPHPPPLPPPPPSSGILFWKASHRPPRPSQSFSFSLFAWHACWTLVGQGRGGPTKRDGGRVGRRELQHGACSARPRAEHVCSNACSNPLAWHCFGTTHTLIYSTEP